MPTSAQLEKYTRPLDYLAFAISNFLDQNPNFLEETFQKEPAFFETLYTELKKQKANGEITPEQYKALYQSIYLSFLVGCTLSDSSKYGKSYRELNALIDDSTYMLAELERNKEIYTQNKHRLHEAREAMRAAFREGDIPQKNLDHLAKALDQIEEQGVVLDKMKDSIDELHKQIDEKRSLLKKPMHIEKAKSLYNKARVSKSTLMANLELKSAFVRLLMRCQANLSPQQNQDNTSQQNQRRGPSL